ncbi:MAG: tyrosine-type recombinase/integrase [Candidatus Omnitrophota bacterium]
MNKAKAWGIIKTGIPKVKVFKVDNTRVRYLEELEAQKLIQACEEPLKSVVLLALNLELRRSELLNLRWQDINFTEPLSPP